MRKPNGKSPRRRIRHSVVGETPIRRRTSGFLRMRCGARGWVGFMLGSPVTVRGAHWVGKRVMWSRRGGSGGREQTTAARPTASVTAALRWCG